MTYTSIEQSNKLVSKGLNPNTADGRYIWYSDQNKWTVEWIPYSHGLPEEATEDKILPCWSTEELFNLLPDQVNAPGIKNLRLPSITKLVDCYHIGYWDDQCPRLETAYPHLIDALMDIIKFLLSTNQM